MLRIKYLIYFFTVIIVFFIGFILFGIFNPNPGKYYSIGVKEGYAYYCNFEYESGDYIHGNEHYELGYGEGFKKAKINQCDEEYFKKL